MSHYRPLAAACMEIARDLEPVRKLPILAMAEIWLRIVEEAEKKPVITLVRESQS